MKKICFIMLAVFTGTIGWGQSVSEIKADRNHYLWGEGKGNTLKKADSEALSDLINQISTTVESSFSLLQQENGQDFSETFQSVISTYSSATLSNTERIVISNEPNAHVFRYVQRSEINRIFASRKFKILEYTSAAIEAEKNLQIADALRYYYWAQTLLRSHPEGSAIIQKAETGEERLLATWIPLQINTLFSKLSLYLMQVKREETFQTVELAIEYEGTPVRNFDYTYWDGRDWSNIVSAKDGRGVAELPLMANISELRLKGEYTFEGEATVDAELRDVLARLDAIPYRSCYLNVRPKTIKESQVCPPVINMEKNEVVFKTIPDSNHYLSVIRRVEEAIRNQNYEPIRECFEAEGYEMFTRLINYGQGRIYGKPVYRIMQSGKDIICRSLSLSFHFPSSNRTFVEDVIFEFSEKHKIRSLSFGLSQLALQDIISKTMWNEHSRMTLIRFLENYKTAYALKRLDYLESIFADDALIIVGSVLKKQAIDDTYKAVLDKQVIRYTHQTKEQYMKRLKNVFASNEFVNLRFADNQIRKSGTQGELYGIQIRQDYFSTSYGDSGYLFLMVDLNQTDKPLIHVRAWQPEKDPEFGVIDLSHFTF